MSERTHRHELEKNVLADWMAEKYEILKPYGTQLAVAGLIAVGLVVAAVFYFSQTDTAAPRAWETYFATFGEQDKVAETLKDVFDKPPVKGTTAEFWARLSYADQRFQVAALRGGLDSQEAKTALADAERALTDIDGKTSDPMLTARIRFSLARINESQNEPDKARDYYQKIVDAGKDTALGKRAAEAIKRLDPNGEPAQVLAWLAEQKPAIKPPGSGNSPFDSLGPGFGGFGGFGQPQPTLPERPNLNLPATSPFGPSGEGGIDFGRDDPLGSKGATPDTTAPDLNAPATSEPKTGEPATRSSEGEKPGSEKPAAEAPPSEKPAEPAKAANEKSTESPKSEPAESKP